MEGITGFILAGFALAGSPGPATLSLAAAGAAFGARRGVPYLAGVVSGMVIVIAATASGVTGVLMALPGATPIFAILAGAYFIYLAYRIATAPPLASAEEQGSRPYFLGGVFLSLINPKGYAAMAALFSGFDPAAESLALDAAIKAAIILGIIVLVHSAWLATGAALTRFFRKPRTNRVINLTFAALLIASVAFALLL